MHEDSDVGHMRLLGTLLLVLVVLIGGMAVLVGLAMVVDPGSIETSLVLLVFLAALAGCCWAMGAWLRRTAQAALDWDDEPGDRFDR